MNSRWLNVGVGQLAALVLAANYAMMLDAQCTNKPGACQCVVTLMTQGVGTYGNNPSCSVRMTYTPNFTGTKLKDCSVVEPGDFDRIVMCDFGIKAKLTCQTSTIIVANGTATQLTCTPNGPYQPNVTAHPYVWDNNIGTPSTNTPALRAPSLSQFAGSRSAAAQPVSTILTATEALTLTAGDAGIQVDSGIPRVTVTAGQATVVSMCDGSTAQVNAPAVLHILNDTSYLNSLVGSVYDPNAGKCTVGDINGNWRGGYVTTNVAGNEEAVPVTIGIQGSGGTVTIGGQQLKISEVTFSSQFFSVVAYTADQSGSVSINGTIDKGDMLFRAVPNITPNLITPGSGSAERLYIAQFALPDGAANAPYRQQLYAVTPAVGAVTWSVSNGSFPGGMSLDPSAGTISGTPNATGDYTFTVKAVDAKGDTFLQPLKLSVRNFALAANILPVAFNGQSYQYDLQVVGGKAPYQFTNNLPLPGLPQLSSTGRITWQGASGSSSVQVMFKVTDSAGVTQPMVVEIPLRYITLTGSEYLPAGTVGSPYDATFPVNGSTGAVSWSLSTDLTGTGLTFDANKGELSGTPLMPLSIYLTVTASDTNNSDSRDFDLFVNSPAAVTIPVVSGGGVVNAATNSAGTASGGGIAQGSFIAIYGTGLGPASPVTAAALPLTATLGNSTVTITSSTGPAVQAYPVYVSATQINAIVPSNVPVGSATVTVTYGTTSSAPVPVTIVRSSFGMFTANYGSGPAAAIDLTTPNPFLSASNAAHPGDFVTIFGTGLGPVSVPDNQAPGGAISPTGLTVQVVIGGQTITPTYAGRSPQYPGEDQINFQLPSGNALSTGCSVAVTITVNGAKSNAATLPIAASGQNCTTP